MRCFKDGCTSAVNLTDSLALLGDAAMSDLFLLTEAQMRQIAVFSFVARSCEG